MIDALGHVGWLWLTVIVASVARSMTGWAFSITAVPMLGLLFAPRQAVVLNILLALLATGKQLPALIRGTSRPTFLPLLWSGLLGAPLGVMLHQQLGADTLRVTVGVLVLVLSAAMAWVPPRPRVLTSTALAAAGFASGVMGGAVGIAGPPVVLLFVLSATDLTRSRATLGLGLFSICLLATGGFAWHGDITLALLGQLALAIPALVIGDRIGQVLAARHDRHDDRNVVRRLTILLTLGMGVLSIAKGLGWLA